jgi:hypothetical protein
VVEAETAQNDEAVAEAAPAPPPPAVDEVDKSETMDEQMDEKQEQPDEDGGKEKKKKKKAKKDKKKKRKRDGSPNRSPDCTSHFTPACTPPPPHPPTHPARLNQLPARMAAPIFLGCLTPGLLVCRTAPMSRQSRKARSVKRSKSTKGVPELSTFFAVAVKKCQLCDATGDGIEAPTHLPCGPGELFCPKGEGG